MTFNPKLTPPGTEKNLFHDHEFMGSLRQHMMKFAILQIKNQHQAEDAVQEAIILAYQHIDKFQRKAALKTWIFSILKNKLIDILRKERRLTTASELEDGYGLHGDALLEKLFDDRGHWIKQEVPKQWHSPEQDIENKHFWMVFDMCLNAMPQTYSRYFMMREFLELNTQEICHNEGLTANQLNVTLYRARLRLRECLENNWYQNSEESLC